MNDSTPPPRYSTEEVNRIIRRALKLDEDKAISHDELLKTASELGIDPSRIEAAITQEAAALEKERFRAAYLKRARSAFKASLYGFLVLNAFLFTIDCMTGGGWWFQWPLLGTGLPLALSLGKAYFPSDARIARAQRRIARRKKRKTHRRRAYRETRPEAE